MMRDATDCNRLQVLQCFYNVDTRCDSFVKFIGWKSLSLEERDACNGRFHIWLASFSVSRLEKKLYLIWMGGGNFVGEEY